MHAAAFIATWRRMELKERGAKKMDDGDGWADVWFRGHFAWEYKG